MTQTASEPKEMKRSTMLYELVGQLERMPALDPDDAAVVREEVVFALREIAGECAEEERTCSCDFDCDRQDPTSCVPCEGQPRS